jgi:hypothetical protein
MEEDDGLAVMCSFSMYDDLMVARGSLVIHN